MMHQVISADTHLLEPADLWTTRLPKGLRDRAARSYVSQGHIFFVTPAGNEFAFTQYRDQDGPIELYPTPEQRAADIAADGVWGGVVNPGLGLLNFCDDPELAIAHARVYNDYVAEFFGDHLARHKPHAMLPLGDVEAAVKEVERVAGLGLTGLLVPIGAPTRYCTKDYDAVWAAAQANGMVAVVHAGAGDPSTARMAMMLRDEFVPGADSVEPTALYSDRMQNQVTAHLSVQNMITDLAGGGVLERFPDLHWVITEYNANWVAGLMGAIDKAYTLGIGQEVSGPQAAFGLFDHTRAPDDQPLMSKEYALNDKWPFRLRPSDYVRRQVHFTFQDDPTAIALRGFTGTDCLMWGSDYPHHEGTWPRSQDALKSLFAGVPDADRVAITGGTLAKLFGF
jgi:predicted TIM-barrel fold metal-dependent hydrolase